MTSQIPFQSDLPAGYLLTSYTYDQLNHLTQVAMPRNTANGMVTQTRTFVYDPTTQRLTSATNPENGTVSYTYNAGGSLATKKDANGNTEGYTYDTYGRLTAIPDRQQTFTYDTCPTNATGCVSMAGQLVQAAFGSMVGPNDLSFEYNYAYTPAGKLSSKTLEVQSANHISMQGVQAYGTLTASYTYDNQGALTSMVYPTEETWAVSPTQTFTYTLDAMERPTGLTDSLLGKTWASGATYNAASQPLYDGTATRTYNNLLQVTSVTGAGINMTYNYSPNKNNGQIASSLDQIPYPNETITYQYDALKRLLSASGKNWGETYGYDGFANLTQMQPSSTAGAPSLSVTVDPATNRLTSAGAQYNNNGNLLVAAGVVYQYDAANRLSEVQTNGNSYYGYDSDNRRIYYGDVNNNEVIYFYGADGKKLATYTYRIITYNGNPEIQLTQQSENVYFLGKLITAENAGVTTDRLGSVRSGGPGGLGYQAQYPYGVEYTLTANDREKYATYTRDSLTGLDYAVNRYYSSQWGRFLSPDPYVNSAGLGDPGSWNRYAYAMNDPVNLHDPEGLGPCGWIEVENGPAYWVPCPDDSGPDGAGSHRPMSDSDQNYNRVNGGRSLSEDCLGALKSARQNAAAVQRALAAETTLQAAVKGTDISWAMLAAVGVEESGFQNVTEKDSSGIGVGVFQITVNSTTNVTAAEAGNLTFAAGWAANLLKTNMAYLAAKFPNFTPTQLLQATAASYNLGKGGISGNPNTIDLGTMPDGNYGITVLGLMNCFH